MIYFYVRQNTEHFLYEDEKALKTLREERTTRGDIIAPHVSGSWRYQMTDKELTKDEEKVLQLCPAIPVGSNIRKELLKCWNWWKESK